MRHQYRTICARGLVLLAGLGGFRCSDHETGLFIGGVLLIAPPQCIGRPDPSSVQLLEGTLDVGLRPDYRAMLLVGNQLTPRGDKQNLRTETMITTITGAVIVLSDAEGAVTEEFSVTATGVIQPDSSDDAGFGLVNVTLIPGEVGGTLAGQLGAGGRVTRVARVKVFGTTLGGQDVESSEFTYVITVCRDCLYYVPPGVDCTDAEAAPDPTCRPGQDEIVDCRNLG